MCVFCCGCACVEYYVILDTPNVSAKFVVRKMCSTVECSVWFARNGYSVRKVGEQMDLMALFAEELDDWVSLAKKFTIQK